MRLLPGHSDWFRTRYLFSQDLYRNHINYVKKKKKKKKKKKNTEIQNQYHMIFSPTEDNQYY